MEDPEYPRVLSPLTKGPITQFILEGKQVKSPDIPDVRYNLINPVIFMAVNQVISMAFNKVFP